MQSCILTDSKIAQVDIGISKTDVILMRSAYFWVCKVSRVWQLCATPAIQDTVGLTLAHTSDFGGRKRKLEIAKKNSLFIS